MDSFNQAYGIPIISFLDLTCVRHWMQNTNIDITENKNGTKKDDGDFDLKANGNRKQMVREHVLLEES